MIEEAKQTVKEEAEDDLDGPISSLNRKHLKKKELISKDGSDDDEDNVPLALSKAKKKKASNHSSKAKKEEPGDDEDKKPLKKMEGLKKRLCTSPKVEKKEPEDDEDEKPLKKTWLARKCHRNSPVPSPAASPTGIDVHELQQHQLHHHKRSNQQSLCIHDRNTKNIFFSDLINSMSLPEMEPPSLCLSSNQPTSLVPPAPDRRHFPSMPVSAHMSATVPLQRAAQMGAAASGSSFLRGFGLAASTSSLATVGGGETQWQEHTSISAGLGLGLSYDSGCAAAGLPDIMMGSAALFDSKPSATLDFLGLAPVGGANSGGLSAFINSIGGGGLERNF